MAKENKQNKQSKQYKLSKDKASKMYKRYESKFPNGEPHLDEADFVAEVIKRRKHKSHDVVMDIVRDTKYDISQAQARSLRKAMAKYNAMVEEKEQIKVPTIRDIRKGNIPEEFKSALSLRYEELRKSGLSWQDAKDTISQEYFGSPE